MGQDAHEWNEAVERLRGLRVEDRWQSEDVAKLYMVALKVAPSLLGSFALPEGTAEDFASALITQKLHKFVDCTGTPFAFFVVSLKNKAKSWKRHERVRADYEERGAASEPSAGADSDPDPEDKRVRALGLLSPKERGVFEALGREEPREEIARRLGTSRPNVDKIISRARKRLADNGLP